MFVCLQGHLLSQLIIKSCTTQVSINKEVTCSTILCNIDEKNHTYSSITFLYITDWASWKNDFEKSDHNCAKDVTIVDHIFSKCCFE